MQAFVWGNRLKVAKVLGHMDRVVSSVFRLRHKNKHQKHVRNLEYTIEKILGRKPKIHLEEELLLFYTEKQWNTFRKKDPECVDAIRPLITAANFLGALEHDYAQVEALKGKKH